MGAFLSVDVETLLSGLTSPTDLLLDMVGFFSGLASLAGRGPFPSGLAARPRVAVVVVLFAFFELSLVLLSGPPRRDGACDFLVFVLVLLLSLEIFLLLRSVKTKTPSLDSAASCSSLMFSCGSLVVTAAASRVSVSSWGACLLLVAAVLTAVDSCCRVVSSGCRS